MIGIVVIFLASWLLLYFFESKGLNVLGIFPLKKTIIEFIFGIFYIFLITLIVIGIDTYTYKIEWNINTNIDYSILAHSFWYHLKSALTEDLVFRGAILYILVSKLGIRTGLLLSATIFGIYHWFSFEMLNKGIRIIPLLYVFLITGASGFAWAYAFIKTHSIMMPLGFHVGSNFIFSLYYKNAPYGELVFTELSKIKIEDQWLNLLYLVSKGLIAPVLTIIFIKYWVRKND